MALNQLAVHQAQIVGGGCDVGLFARPVELERKRAGGKILHRFSNRGIVSGGFGPAQQEPHIVLGVIAETEFPVHGDGVFQRADRRRLLAQIMFGDGDIELHDGSRLIVHRLAVKARPLARLVQRLLQLALAAGGIAVRPRRMELVGDVGQPRRTQQQQHAHRRPRRQDI